MKPATCRKLTKAEAMDIKVALDAARKGAATLKQLAHAHTLAEEACLNGTIGELRGHIRRLAPAPPGHTEAKSILLGIVAGVITNFILRGKGAA